MYCSLKENSFFSLPSLLFFISWYASLYWEFSWMHSVNFLSISSGSWSQMFTTPLSVMYLLQLWITTLVIFTRREATLSGLL